MGIFKKKNQQTVPETKDPNADLKTSVLEKLNEKLKGTLYDECVIMPKGFTIDVQINRYEEKDEIKLLNAAYVVRNDDFDEPLIEMVDSQGKSDDEAAAMSVDIFYAGLWHPIEQSVAKRNPVHIPVDFMRQHYDFDMYCQSVVRIGVKDKQPVMLMSYIRSELPKYLGSKKYYWVRVYLARFKDKKVVEVRVNGSVCTQLANFYRAYVDGWDADENFISEKQYALFVQREDDKCPFSKELVMKCAQETISMMENIKSPEEYAEMSRKLEEMAGDKGLAAEIRIFIPEIFAKLTLGYREGDSLFVIDGESTIEIRKTQLRSYFYLQQAVLEYLSKRPEQEKVTRIVANSVAFRELRKAMDQGHKPDELFVPGTSYKINIEGYKVW